MNPLMNATPQMFIQDAHETNPSQLSQDEFMNSDTLDFMEDHL